MILHLMLGTACNWKCKYCIQIKQAGFPQKMDKSFCDKLKDFILSNNIQIDRIEYWGGEPCLYFDQIKQLEEAIPNKQRPSRFVTNGSLLTMEMVDFLNKQDMFVNLSYHEGQLNNSGWETALHIKNLHVTSLIHAKCLTWEPYFEKWQWVYDTYGRCIPWYVYNLYNVKNAQEYCLTESNITFYTNYLKYVIDNKLNNVFYRTALEALFKAELGKQRNYSCACYNPDILSIDTKGNQYICHHACSNKYSVGNIFTSGISTLKLNTLKSKCSTCKILPHCGGGCMREINDSSCYFLHRLYDLKQYFESKYEI